MSEAINYLSLAQKAGRIETGEENSGIAVRTGKARLLVLALDASDNARRRALGYVGGRKTPLVTAPYTKLEISSAVGKNGCSMLTFTDIGLAAGFAGALETAHPGEYSELCAELNRKKERAAQRAGETRARRRAAKTGKRGGQSNEQLR